MLNMGLYRGALFLYEVALPSLCEHLLGVPLAGDRRCAEDKNSPDGLAQ